MRISVVGKNISHLSLSLLTFNEDFFDEHVVAVNDCSKVKVSGISRRSLSWSRSRLPAQWRWHQICIALPSVAARTRWTLSNVRIYWRDMVCIRGTNHFLMIFQSTICAVYFLSGYSWRKHERTTTTKSFWNNSP
jgi:hypothetical protein